MLDASLDTGDSARDVGLVGRTFGQYHIISLIQRGGMGEIYLANLEPQKIKVVLKRLQEAHTSDERYVEMFQNEAAVMSGLEHPNIVKVLGVPVIEGRQCLVLEFVKGRNLQQVLKRLRKLGRKLSPVIGVHIMRKVLLGLHEAHHARFPDGRSLELVHRDVKPGNILISFAGDIKITDFGIAKSAMQNRMTTAGVVKGTVRYLSPEQIRSEKITFRSDLFSCASVLVEMLTDQPLYDRGPVAPTLMAILNDDRASIEELLPFRSPELAQVIEKGLCSRPRQRYGSALEFAQSLVVASRTLGPSVSDDHVGALLRQLFQSSTESSKDRGSIPEDVTYLVANDPLSSGPRKAPRPKGASPLDAKAFNEEPMLPPEYQAAERRADSMLQSDFIIENPVELLDDGLELDDLDLDVLDLDVLGEAPDPLSVSASEQESIASELGTPVGEHKSNLPKRGASKRSPSVSRPQARPESVQAAPRENTQSSGRFRKLQPPPIPPRASSVRKSVSTPIASIRPKTLRGGYALVERQPIRESTPLPVNPPMPMPAESRRDVSHVSQLGIEEPRAGTMAIAALCLYLLIGCLSGVVLTCVVLFLGKWHFH